MLKKLFLILILLNVLQGCGYSPMYSANNKLMINIEEINSDGDWELNNYIKSSLRRHSSDNKTEKFKIKLDTIYNKSSIEKDSAGNTTKYLFEIEVNVNINSTKINKNFLFKEKFTMDNFEDSLVEKNYESSNKNNIANLIVDKLIVQLANLE
jgi:hypothetical protein